MALANLNKKEEKDGMKIAHIFNAVDKKHENNTTIDTQEFMGKFWIKKQSHYSYDKEEYDSDFSRLYYHGLVPSNDDNLISKYDDDKIARLKEKLGKDLILISGDFWGIQKFITEDLTTKKASKILRSRSAMVLLITYAISKEIQNIFKGSETLLFGAGKFTILAKEEGDYRDKIKSLQDELNNYFLQNYFGQNGFILSTSKDMNIDKLGKDNELKKLKKFDLLNCSDEDILIDPFKGARRDDDICEFCKKRVANSRVDKTTLSCDICANEIRLGRKLTKKRYISIYGIERKKSKNHIELIKLNNKYYYASFSNYTDNLKDDIFDITHEPFYDYPQWALNSYVPIDELGDVKNFNEYVKEGQKVISSGLMALKADIDKLGDTFRELYREDFRKFNRLSREVEYFFSTYITSLIEKKRNVYTVFAGGDDLFLIGEYREIVELAKEIRKEFLVFSLGKTTISMGLVMFKPTTPINFVSKMADNAEKRAKKERDSIDIFGVSMKFDEFFRIEKEFKEVIDFLEEYSQDTTTFYYRLIELCDMKESVDRALNGEKRFNPNDALWKSKLNYLFKRNIRKEDNKKSRIFDILSQLIELGEQFKPFIFLKIYNNRDRKKEISYDEI